MARPTLLSARDVAVGWEGRSVLSGVDLSIVAGETTVLVGPNGSGKSTLLRALLGLSRPLAGTITRAEGWRAGYVPQRDVSAPLLRLSAIEVVAMAASGTWLPFAGRAARHAVAAEALSAVSLQDLGGRAYRDLSGGQRQRVLLARALAADPSVLVLDEPTVGLDVRAERELLRLVRRLREEHEMACLIVTHSLDVARREANVVGLLHEGRCRVGVAAELLTTESLESVYGAHA